MKIKNDWNARALDKIKAMVADTEIYHQSKALKLTKVQKKQRSKPRVTNIYIYKDS